jgi:hypothetical protein
VAIHRSDRSPCHHYNNNYRQQQPQCNDNYNDNFTTAAPTDKAGSVTTITTKPQQQTTTVLQPRLCAMPFALKCRPAQTTCKSASITSIAAKAATTRIHNSFGVLTSAESDEPQLQKQCEVDNSKNNQQQL